jgi:hypothetical protein
VGLNYIKFSINEGGKGPVVTIDYNPYSFFIYIRLWGNVRWSKTLSKR